MPTAAELARAIGATVEGDGAAPIAGVGLLETAGAADLTFIVSADLAARARASASRVVIAPPGADLPGKTVLRHGWPKVAFARALALLAPPERPAAGVHPSAVVDPSAELGTGVAIGPHAVVEAGCVLGDRVVLEAGVALGTGVRLGADAWLHAGVVCYRGVTIGARTIVHANTVIGAEGYGYVQEGADPAAPEAADWHRYQQHASPHVRLPQLGTVVIGDDVEIGACCCIDRGTIGATSIGNGTKLDNLVQVAHNVTVGEHCLVTAQVALSGSTTVGRHVTIGGNAGVAEGVTIGDRALLAAKTAVPPRKVIPEGAAVIGIPAHLGEKGIAIVAAQTLLPKLVEQVRELRRRLKAVEHELDAERSS